MDIVTKKLNLSAESGVIKFGGNVHIGGNLSAGTYLVSSSGSNRSIADHYHSLSADASGNVTLGTWTWDSSKASFNMADTTFFKESMSAIQKKYEVDTMSTSCTEIIVPYNDNGKKSYYSITTVAKNADKEKLKSYTTKTGYECWSRGYDVGKADGKESVSLSQVRCTGHTDSTVSLYIKLSNGNDYNRTVRMN